jgi:hypothetical protein
MAEAVVTGLADETAVADDAVVSPPGAPSCIDKVVFDACVNVTRGAGEPHVVSFQFLFRHFDGMQDLKNADGELEPLGSAVSRARAGICEGFSSLLAPYPPLPPQVTPSRSCACPS